MRKFLFSMLTVMGTATLFAAPWSVVKQVDFSSTNLGTKSIETWQPMLGYGQLGTFLEPNAYCTPTASSNDSTGILKVTFNTINNSSSSNGAYTDYTGTHSTTVQAGNIYPLSVMIDTASEDGWDYTVNVRAWIDWNQNENFTDAGEVYNLGSLTGGNNNPPSGSPLNITIPEGTPAGEYRLRIRAGYSTVPAPCGNHSYSEAEDYKIIVEAGSGGGSADPCSVTTLSNGFENGHGFIQNAAMVAHDFKVSANSKFTVTAFDFNTLTVSTTSAVKLTFFEDDSGKPGAVKYTATGLTPTITSVGSAFGFNVQKNAVTLPTPLEFEGGLFETTYWVAAQVTSTGDTYWEDSSVANGTYNGKYSADGTTWLDLTGGSGLWNGVMNIVGTCEDLGGPVADCTINTFPFTEDFEATSTTRGCWTNEYVNGTINWVYGTGGVNTPTVTTAHSGSVNMVFNDNTVNPYVTKYVSPEFDLSSLSTPTLKFWYVNENWFGDLNELRVYYKTSAAGAWTLIPGAVYTSDVTAWTEVTLDLPNPSATYYIAFEGTNAWTKGLLLDDVSVVEGNENPEPEPGDDECANLIVTSLPYDHAGNTGTYGNHVTAADVPALAGGAIGTGTFSTSYVGGDDAVYAYTPTEDEVINILVTTPADNDAGLFVFTGCPFTATVGYHTSLSGLTRSVENLPVTAGVTYYILISTWPTPNSTDYTIHIEKVGGGEPEPGDDCANIIVDNLPFTHSGNTSAYGNDFSSSDVPPLASGAVTTGTGNTSYLNGDDVVFAYTPTANETLRISTTNDNDWIGLWAFVNCPFTSTVGYHTDISGTTRLIEGLEVTAGQTYYFVISTWPAPQSTNYSILIEKMGGGGEPGEGEDCEQGIASASTLPNAFNIATTSSFRSAEDFTVVGTFTMNKITIDTNQQAVPNNAIINIRRDNGGQPGAVEHTITAAPDSSETLGTAFGDPIYRLTFELDTPIELEEGTWWIDPKMSTSTGEVVWWAAVDYSSSHGANLQQSSDNGVTWAPNTDFTGVFKVYGVCSEGGGGEPEPNDGCFNTGSIDQWPSSTYVPSCNGSVEDITTNGWAGEYSKVQVTAGTTYTFSSSVGTDFITIAKENVPEAYTTGTGSVTWTAVANEVIRFFTHTDDQCGIASVSRARRIQCGDTPEPGTYCEPELDCTDGDLILNVTFAGINNDSGCSPNGYGDYTNLVGNVNAGETYPIEVTVGDGWAFESVSVWIDYNNNGTFEQNEFTYVGTGSAGVVYGDIAIPAGQADGQYRMRVRVAAVGEASATGDMACDETQGFGETEDYTIQIGEGGGIGDACEQEFTGDTYNGVGFIVSDTAHYIAANDIVVEENHKFRVDVVELQVVSLAGAPTTFDVSFYEDDNNGVGTQIGSTMTNLTATVTQNGFFGSTSYPQYTVTIALPTPQVLEATPDSDVRYWIGVSGAPSASGQNVYWVSSQYASNADSLPTWQSPDGGASWAMFDDGNGINVEGMMKVSGECSLLAMTDLNSFDFSYYPNPVRDVLYITAKQPVKNVSVYNLAGQEIVNKAKVNNGQIDVRTLATGTYVFRVILENGQVETFKIVKK